MLVREKGDPLVRRPPGIGVLLFHIPYYLIRLDSADGESVSLSASSAGDAASRNVVSGHFGGKAISWFRWDCVCCIG